MKLTSLRIEPKLSYADVSPSNPMMCKVKIQSENSLVETIVSDELCKQILDLVSGAIAVEAEREMQRFVAESSKGIALTTTHVDVEDAEVIDEPEDT